MAEKLDMKSMDITQENIAKIRELFPSAVTEVIDGYTKDESGKEQPIIKLKVDFDVLKQELSDTLIEDKQERYQMTWPDKTKSKLLASSRITSTLRPDKEKSVDFDNTQNLYIEGDNLDVLKLLREAYLGKVKMIYIDPPYNTGNDFIYEDDFTIDSEEYMGNSGQYDEQGNRLVQNKDSNGRFHTDWLNMIYPRLKVAKDLLSDDGVIFISIDDNEVDNLRKVCDEIFGKKNFRNQLLVRRRIKSLNLQFANDGLNSFNVAFEYIIVYSKSEKFLFKPLRVKKVEASEKGTWNVFWSNADRPTMRYELLGFTPSTGQWRWQKELAEEAVKNYEIYEKQFANRMSLEEYWEFTGKKHRFIRRIPDGYGKNGGVQYWVAPLDTSLRTSNWTDIEVSQIAKDFDLPFENPKNVNLIKTLIDSVFGNDIFVLDFFSGSSTTADAVMQLNAEDGGNRKFIMVQLPEKCDENSEAYKAGYKTICDIGEERIRRAGQKIIAEHKANDLINSIEILDKEKNLFGLNRSFDDIISDNSLAKRLDIGFRVLRLDSSNMQDVYYDPNAVKQSLLDMTVDNIKADRTPLDLLFQVMLDLGKDLSAKIEERQVQGKTIYSVGGNDLVACFDDNITNEVIVEIAKQHPLYAVFKDKSFASDSVAINNEQLFKTYSPSTTIKVI